MKPEGFYPAASDTIAAVATPAGTGAISVIRITGNEAFEIAGRVFAPASLLLSAPDRRVFRGRVFENGVPVDDVLAVKFSAPRSYTGEDTVEISCHGGSYITRRVLGIILSAGARPAEPGEFTKRAFLNGKLDLIQAEAVQELIAASSERAVRCALSSLAGGVSGEIRTICNRITALLAALAVTMDYPEYSYETENDLTVELAQISAHIKRLASTYDKGSLYKNGVRIAIVGRPNAGKSTFLNAFAGKNRAIVTDIPGTTRDTIDEMLEIAGVPVILTDTAGLRDTEDPIEKLGQEKTRQAIEEAQILLHIVDSAEGFLKDDRALLLKYRQKHIIIVLNKIDKVGMEALELLERETGHSHVVRTSMLDRTGIVETEAVIKEIIGPADETGEHVITSLRHTQTLLEAAKLLDAAAREFISGVPADICEPAIRQASELLWGMLGKDADIEIMDSIFSRFCIGK